jgi:hypothetical protein
VPKETLIPRRQTVIVEEHEVSFDTGMLAEELSNVLRLVRPRNAAPPFEASSPNSLSELEDTLNLVTRAAAAMTAMEDRANLIQAKAIEIMDRSRQDVRAANLQVANLQARLIESEDLATSLEVRLAEAEERTTVARNWLGRFHEAVTKSFMSHGTPTSPFISEGAADSIALP